MKKLFLVRHGQSVVNLDPRLYFVEGALEHEFGLTPTGEKQARAAGCALQKQMTGPYSVYVSPYRRAVATLEGILIEMNRPPVTHVVDVRIREQEFMMSDSFEAYQARKLEREKHGKLAYRFGNAESGYDLMNRVGGFWNQLRTDWILGRREDNVVIVAHELVIRCLIILALELPPEEFETMWIKNGEVKTLWANDNLDFVAALAT